MPQTREEPHDEDVAVHLEFGAAVAAEGYVDVFSEPGAHGDMPSSPELRYALGNVGVIEILLEGEAQHLAEAYCHIGISREIEIYLERVEYDAEPRAQYRGGDGGAVAQAVPQLARAVCQKYLLREAADEGTHTGGEHVYVMGAGAKLIVHVLIAHDGARDKLGEQGYVRAEGRHVSLHLRVAAVDVYGIGHGLEGIEGDTDGQLYIRKGRYALQEIKGQKLQIGDDESIVLEKSQHRQIEYGAGYDELFRLFLVCLPVLACIVAADIVHHDGIQHYDHVYGLAPAVECKADDKEHDVSQLQGHDIVYEYRDREEEKQEFKR